MPVAPRNKPTTDLEHDLTAQIDADLQQAVSRLPAATIHSKLATSNQQQSALLQEIGRLERRLCLLEASDESIALLQEIDPKSAAAKAGQVADEREALEAEIAAKRTRFDALKRIGQDVYLAELKTREQLTASAGRTIVKRKFPQSLSIPKNLDAGQRGGTTPEGEKLLNDLAGLMIAQAFQQNEGSIPMIRIDGDSPLTPEALTHRANRILRETFTAAQAEAKERVEQARVRGEAV